MLKGAIEAAIRNTLINNPPTVNQILYQQIPGYLVQADVLQSIAPILVNRSDTFLIRAYGDYENPTNPGVVASKAYCEAVVQRVQDYVDNSQPPGTLPAALNTVNTNLGRRFKITSFRWLSPNDI